MTQPSQPVVLSLGRPRPLREGWRLTMTAAGAHAHPDTLANDAETIEAFVPGTAANALEKAGRFDRAAPRPLHDQDIWYRTTLSDPPGSAVLRFEGLATIAEVFLNGEKILASDSMYIPHDVAVVLTGNDELAICFRALLPEISKKGPRARWRTKMITPPGVRLKRTTLFGFMPGWCPEIHAVGPWRAIGLLRPLSPLTLDGLDIRARLDIDGTGYLTVGFHADMQGLTPRIRCAGCEIEATETGPNQWQPQLRLPDVEPWWPQTHGRPALHDIALIAGPQSLTIGRTGFRRIEVDRQADGNGFLLKINGVPVFCRGAVWTSADIVALPGGSEDYRPWLTLAAQAGMNMIRIGGTMAYETPAFFSLCDELGLMVWQDCMLANFDYPAGDPVFLDAVRWEVEHLLTATRASPSLTVLCGGSEVYQQAAMLGLPERIWAGALTETLLPEIAFRIRPDIVFVANSPSGGALPFSPNAGITHYYGVGAYCRPFEDARRADVRFAAECLAFSHVPEQATLTRHLDVAPVHDPRWKARVPRDRDASWDFEDIRDHYLQLLYALDPVRLRREQPGRYLTLSRAVTGEVVEASFAEWRREGSGCGGALVWTFQDLMPGAGWGVIDATGLPKPVWHAMRRAFRPIQIMLLDEGTNGLDVHILNETRTERRLLVEVSCLRAGLQPVVGGKREIMLAPGSAMVIPATDLFGAFFDTTYAYRFSAPQHDVTLGRLFCGETGGLLADAFHFPRGRAAALHETRIESALSQQDKAFALDLTATRFAQSVHIEAEGFHLSDNWFHLAPGRPRRILLTPDQTDRPGAPTGEIADASGMTVGRF